MTEGATWQRQRRMLMPAFAPKRMAGYAGLHGRGGPRDALAACPGGLVAMDVFFSHVTMDVIPRALQRRAGAETAEAAAATQVLSETGFREMFWPATLPDWLPLPGKAPSAVRWPSCAACCGGTSTRQHAPARKTC